MLKVVIDSCSLKDNFIRYLGNNNIYFDKLVEKGDKYIFYIKPNNINKREEVIISLILAKYYFNSNSYRLILDYANERQVYKIKLIELYFD